MSDDPLEGPSKGLEPAEPPTGGVIISTAIAVALGLGAACLALKLLLGPTKPRSTP